MRKIFKLLVIVFFSFCLALTVSVVIDRIMGYFLYKNGYFKAMVPGLTELYKTKEFDTSVKISAQGLRNATVAVPKPDGVFRILALGDSFTLGFGVDEDKSWPKLLEKSLNSSGKKVEVINAGVAGMGMGQETDVCQAYKDQFQPDMYLVGFYATDDLYQMTSTEQNRSDRTKIINFLWPSLSRIKRPVLDPQYAGGFDFDKELTVDHAKLWKLNASVEVAQYPQIIKNIDPSIRVDFLNGLINPNFPKAAELDNQYWIKMLNEDNRNLALSYLSQRLNNFKLKCSGNKPTVIIMIPSMDLVSKSYFEFRSKLGFEMDDGLLDIDLDKPVGQLVKKAGFGYLSIISDFRQDGCPGCYYNWDSHFTEEGHRRLSDYLIANLKI